MIGVVVSRYAAAIADLERRRDLIAGALKALHKLEGLAEDGSALVESRAGLPAAPEVAPPPKFRPATTPGPKPGTRHGLKVTLEGWARARVMWDADDSAEKIGKVIGCTGARVNQYAREKSWPTRDYGIISRKARLESMGKQAPTKAAARGPRRIVTGSECPKCHVISPTDPCYNCGKAKGKR